jgi:hypothetical protein
MVAYCGTDIVVLFNMPRTSDFRFRILALAALAQVGGESCSFSGFARK